MTTDRTPVLVGAARLTQRVEEPGGGLDAVELIAEAAAQAVADAGAAGLASRIGSIAVPRGMWRCSDPARIVAERLGAPSARTLVAEVGVLQHSLITAACEEIAAGRVDGAIVCGGEARYRHVVAAKAGIDASEPLGSGAPPDGILRPDSDVVSSYELERGIVLPSVQYAMIQSAYTHAAGWSDDEERTRLGALWSHYADVASHDPLAWDRSAPDAETIATPGDGNRMISAPYTRMLCSQWNVDQSAALVLTSVALARELGIAQERWVYPVAATESNAMIPMPQRREVHRWPAFRLAAKRVMELAGCSLDGIDALEIYSCFPSAVLVQMNEMGLARERPLTVTGGMTFGGGPLNNFVLQATVAMAERIRAGEARTGLVTGVSGLLTKPGLTVWSATPPSGGFRSDDVTQEAYRTTATCPMAIEETGRGMVVGVTGQLAVIELDDGSRMVGSASDAGARVGDRVVAGGPGQYRLA